MPKCVKCYEAFEAKEEENVFICSKCKEEQSQDGGVENFEVCESCQ